MKRKASIWIIIAVSLLLVVAAAVSTKLILDAKDRETHRRTGTPTMSDEARTALDGILDDMIRKDRLYYLEPSVTSRKDVTTGTAYPVVHGSLNAAVPDFDLHAFDVPVEPQGWLVLLRTTSSDEPFFYVSITRTSSGQWVEDSYGGGPFLTLMSEYEAAAASQRFSSPLVVDFNHGMRVLSFSAPDGDEIVPSEIAVTYLNILTRYSMTDPIPTKLFLSDLNAYLQHLRLPQVDG